MGNEAEGWRKVDRAKAIGRKKVEPSKVKQIKQTAIIPPASQIWSDDTAAHVLLHVG